MKKGLSDVMFVPKWGAEKLFKEANRTEFTGVEINFSEEGLLTRTTSLSDANKLAHLAANHHVEITSISSELFTKYPLTANDARLRKSGEEISRRMIEFAAEMGINTVNIEPGMITIETSYEKAYDHAVESIKRLGNEAASAGVTIGVENIANKFLSSPKEFIGFLDDINHPAVKAFLNTGHAFVTGFPEHYINMLENRIIGIHVNDYRASLGSYVPVLEGDINWPNVMSTLQNIAYDGYLTSIPPYPHKHGLERHVERYSTDVSALINLLDPVRTAR